MKKRAKRDNEAVNVFRDLLRLHAHALFVCLLANGGMFLRTKSTAYRGLTPYLFAHTYRAVISNPMLAFSPAPENGPCYGIPSYTFALKVCDIHPMRVHIQKEEVYFQFTLP